MKGWQSLFFILRQNRLEYGYNEQDFKQGKHPKGIIQFDTVRVILTELKNFEFNLTL
jgi:hypothetical protein